MKLNSLITAFVAGASLAVVSANAAPIASENFNYPNGPLAGNNGGTGWFGEWLDFQGTPQVSGGQTIIDSTLGQQALRFLESPQLKANGGEVWIAIDAQMFTTGSGITQSYGGIGLYLGNAEQALIGKAWPGEYVWAAGTNQGLVPSTSSTLVPSDVFIRITFDLLGGNDFLDVWINPADPSSLNSQTPDISRNDPDLSFDSIRLRGGINGGLNESWNWSSITIGSSLADVLPVPEPSTTALCLLASGAIVAWRLRRRSLI